MLGPEGIKKALAPNKIGVSRIPGQFFWIDYVVDGEHVSSILFSAMLRPDGFVTINIFNMHTKREYRGNGFAGMLVDAIKQKVFGYKAKYVVTSYDDSSHAGMSVLLKHGFVRKENVLIWENPNADAKGDTDNAGAQEVGSDCGPVAATDDLGDRELPEQKFSGVPVNRDDSAAGASDGGPGSGGGSGEPGGDSGAGA